MCDSINSRRVRFQIIHRFNHALDHMTGALTSVSLNESPVPSFCSSYVSRNFFAVLGYFLWGESFVSFDWSFFLAEKKI